MLSGLSSYLGPKLLASDLIVTVEAAAGEAELCRARPLLVRLLGPELSCPRARREGLGPHGGRRLQGARAGAESLQGSQGEAKSQLQVRCDQDPLHVPAPVWAPVHAGG